MSQKATYNQILHPKHSEQNTCQWYWSGIACDLVLYPPPITAFLLYLSNFVHVRIPGAPNWQGWTYVRSARRKYAPPRCNYSGGFNYQERSPGPQVLKRCHTLTNSTKLELSIHKRVFYSKQDRSIFKWWFPFLWTLCVANAAVSKLTLPGVPLFPPTYPLPPHPPSTPLSIFPNIQENTQRGHGRLEPRPKTAIPIWIQEDTSWGYEQIRHFQ